MDDIKNRILELVTTKSKHYAKIIKNDPELLETVMESSGEYDDHSIYFS